jgi:hypothetical protein
MCLTQPLRQEWSRLIYEGDFSRSKNHISGQWYFKPKKLLFGLIKLRSSGKGTFTMTKTEK